MPKSLEELAASKGGQSVESNGMGSQERPHRPAGIYRHKESGAELIAQWSPKYGSAQADALVRVGYEFVRPATKDDVKEIIIDAKLGAGATDAKSDDDMKGILARLNALESENKELKAQQEEAATAAEAPKEEPKKEEVAADAKTKDKKVENK